MEPSIQLMPARLPCIKFIALYLYLYSYVKEKQWATEIKPSFSLITYLRYPLGILSGFSKIQPTFPTIQVNCAGNETRLDNCAHPGWGDHECGHFEDAGVRCGGPDTTRECVDSCGGGYYSMKGKNECGLCLASCLTCANSEGNCTSCDKPRFLKGKFVACGSKSTLGG